MLSSGIDSREKFSVENVRHNNSVKFTNKSENPGNQYRSSFYSWIFYSRNRKARLIRSLLCRSKFRSIRYIALRFFPRSKETFLSRKLYGILTYFLFCRQSDAPATDSGLSAPLHYIYYNSHLRWSSLSTLLFSIHLISLRFYHIGGIMRDYAETCCAFTWTYW